MRRALAVLGKGLAAVVGLLVLAILLAAGLLLSGPVDLSPWQAELQAAINSRAQGWQVAFAAPRLAWSGERRTLGLGLDQVTVATPAGLRLLRAPHVEIDLDVAGSVRSGRAILDRVVVEGMAFAVTRGADGRFRFDMGGDVLDSEALRPSGASTIGEGDAPWQARLRSLLRPRAERAPVELRALALGGVTARFRDEARDAEIGTTGASVLLECGTGSGQVRARVSLSRGAVELQATADGDDEVAVSAQARGLELLPLLAPWAPVLAGADMALDLDATTVLRPAAPAPIAFRAALAGPSIVLPALLAAPVPVDAATATGSVALEVAPTAVTAELVLRKGDAAAAGTLTLRLAEAGPELRLLASGDRVDPALVTGFWPEDLGPRVRSWVVERLSAGQARDATVDLSFDPRSDPKLGVDLRFAFEGGRLRFLDSMPPVEEGRGTARITRRQLDFEVAAGRLADLAIQHGKVGITIVPGEDDRLGVEGALDGTVPAALAVVRTLPGGIGQDPRLEAAALSGSGRYELSFAMPLIRDPPRDRLQWHVSARLHDLASDRLVPGLPVNGGEIALDIDRQAVTGTGRLRLGALPARLRALRLPLGRTTTPGHVQATASLDRVALSAYGVPAQLVKSGEVEVAADVTLARERPPDIALALDLTDAEIDVGPLRARKPEGRPGRLDIRFHPDEREVEVDSWALEMPGLAASGSARVGVDRRLSTVVLDAVHLGETRLAGRLDRKADGAVAVALKGATLDLRPWLGSPLAQGVRRPEEPLSGTLALAAEKVLLPGGTLSRLDIEAERDATRLVRITGEAALPSGKPLRLTLAPPGPNGQAFALVTDDAGSFLELLDSAAENEARGELRFRGTVTAQAPLELSGQLVVRDFTVERAPLLAQILTLASLRGIQNALQGKGIGFDRARADIGVQDRIVTITNGRASGSELGLTAEGSVSLADRSLDLSGTVVPFYTLNRIIAGIPIVGNLLAGESGVGAFAATYGVSGTLDRPQVAVNPLAVIVPGFIRDIFAGLPPAEQSDGPHNRERN